MKNLQGPRQKYNVIHIYNKDQPMGGELLSQYSLPQQNNRNGP